MPPPAGYAARAASGHELPNTPVPGRFHVYPEMAAAGLWTTASDLARWGIAISRAYRGERDGILSASMAREMLSQRLVAPPPNSGIWGLGVRLEGEGELLSFSHGGRDEGFLSHIAMFPEMGIGLVVLTNGVNGGLIAEIDRAFRVAYGLPLAQSE